ncbi:MAG: hypothetical protein A2Z16_04985 [Chloroflexi bacterium RBG_16_54_18]|nr:MAG: hypothetical protein A2Z16_04985 [Chloroflexi bacterium RBG_16_54_18]
MYLAVLFVFVAGFALRLYDLTDQPIDFHPTRQLRGAIIARGMYYEMLPTVDENLRQKAVAFWRSTGQYEPSILERLTAITYMLVGGEYIWIARIINALFWMIGGMALFALSRRMAAAALVRSSLSSNSIPRAAILAAIVALAYYVFLPFGVFASRSFQPDPGMVMWLLIFSYFIYRWSEELQWNLAVLAGICGGMAILTKAIAIYTIAGIGVSIFLYSTGFKRPGFIKALKNPQLWSMAGIIVAPPVIYSIFLGNERAAEYFQSWTVALSHLLLQPWFYLRWIALVQRLLTPAVLVLAAVGVLISRSRNQAFFLGAWSGYIVYGLFFPYQMYSHNYYHLQVVALAALSSVPVTCWLYAKAAGWQPVWRMPLVSLVILTLGYFLWTTVIPLSSQDFRNEPSYWQEIASYLPEDGKIIALTQDYGYRLMYYGWKKVSLWPNRGEQNLNSLRGSNKEFSSFFTRQTADKSYFLITSFRQFEDQPELKQELYEHYPIFAQGSGYLIFSMNENQPAPDPAVRP